MVQKILDYFWPMPELTSRLARPPHHKDGCIPVFNKLLELAPYYGEFTSEGLLQGAAQNKENAFFENCRWFGSNEPKGYYDIFFLRNGYAKKGSGNSIEFTDNGRDLKECGSFEEYDKQILDRRSSEIAIRKLSVSFPRNQKITNFAVTSVVLLNLVVASGSFYLSWLQYKETIKDKTTRVLIINGSRSDSVRTLSQSAPK